MKKLLIRVGLGLLGLIVLVGAGGGIYVYLQISAFDASVAKEYDVAPLPLQRSVDPAVIARGKHLSESIAGCAMKDCHGPDFAAGKVTDVGPIGTLAPPNITNILPAYSDGELARLIRHGIKKDKRAARFMPVNEINWLPDSDIVALISYLRTVPPVERTTQPMTIRWLGKVLDRRNLMPLDVVRRIDHAKIELAPAPSPTVEYGRYVAHLCTGCHGEKLSGGKIPGTPPDFPIPLNLTPHPTGMAGWTYEEFEKLAKTGIRKNGKKLVDFMPIEAIANMDDTERRALFAYLMSLPPTEFGQR